MNRLDLTSVNSHSILHHMKIKILIPYRKFSGVIRQTSKGNAITRSRRAQERFQDTCQNLTTMYRYVLLKRLELGHTYGEDDIYIHVETAPCPGRHCPPVQITIEREYANDPATIELLKRVKMIDALMWTESYRDWE